MVSPSVLVLLVLSFCGGSALAQCLDSRAETFPGSVPTDAPVVAKEGSALASSLLQIQLTNGNWEAATFGASAAHVSNLATSVTYNGSHVVVDVTGTLLPALQTGTGPNNGVSAAASLSVSLLLQALVGLFLAATAAQHSPRAVFVTAFVAVAAIAAALPSPPSGCSRAAVVVSRKVSQTVTTGVPTTGAVNPTTGRVTTGVPTVTTTGVPSTPTCATGTGAPAAVQTPTFVEAKRYMSTAWFGSPSISDLDIPANGDMEIVICTYKCFVLKGSDRSVLADTAAWGTSRSYAPHIVADLDRDNKMDICHGNGNNVYCYEWNGAATGLTLKAGWPKDTTTAGFTPEVRGLSAADLDGDGDLEIIATTTQQNKEVDGARQVFVFSANGANFAPGGDTNSWPRYNNLMGNGGDGDLNGCAQVGYGMYGLNVGVGNIDDDAGTLEVITTYDDHELNAFQPNGVSINSSPYFKSRVSTCLNNRMAWGQFIRWADAKVEEDHYNLHTGTWPYPGCGAGEACKEWLQFTASAPNVADLDLDGKNEVISIPNIELGIPYVTQNYGVFVVEGNQGTGDRSMRRKAGWETIPRGGSPITVSGYYPPTTPVAPTIVDIVGDAKLEIVTTLNDGTIRCYDAGGTELWSHNIKGGNRNPADGILFASEVTVADLNRDGVPELLYTTFGSPRPSTEAESRGHLVGLSNVGAELFSIRLPCNPIGSFCQNGNGNGAPGAPAVGDIDGDGTLEIVMPRFDGVVMIYMVPGSETNCLAWPTARGGLLRKGQPDNYV
jgi:FG-GAP-like repeat